MIDQRRTDEFRSGLRYNWREPSLKRVNVISVLAEDLAGTRSFYQEVLGLPLTFEDETAAVFVVDAACTELAKPRTIQEP